MFRYIIRRTLYMIPTIFGVILLTFFLFNVAGGDPGLIKLGKNASAAALEEYDLPRGLNRPLFCGFWGTTRAYQHETFDINAGPWSQIESVTYVPEGKGSIRVNAPTKIPLALDLAPNTDYRWRVTFRHFEKGVSPLLDVSSTNDASGLAAVGVLLESPLNDNPLQDNWVTRDVEFRTGTNAATWETWLRAFEGGLEIRRLELGKRVDHFFDSQLLFYFKQLARGDFGTSVETNQKVTRMILDGIGPSLSLTVPMFFIGLVVELALALVCAFYRNRLIDRFFVVFAVLVMSVNYIVLIMGAQFLFGYKLKWFPVWGYESWHYLILPVVVGIVSGLGSSVRFYRTVMLDEMYRDYVRTAEAKGVGQQGVLFRHVLKNVMIPVITNVVTAIPFLYTGSLLLESFFGIPGLGSLAVNAFNSSDFDVIRAVVFVGAILFVVANLLTDICYTWVDPRVRLQ